jgi:hypothetical protein
MEQLYPLLQSAASKHRLSRTEKETALSLFDEMQTLMETSKNPPGFRLASGEIAKGATGRIALNAYFQLLGRMTLGPDYAWQDKRFTLSHFNLGFAIMNGYFNNGGIKGLYCCPTCTLSVLPLYCMKAYKSFDNDLLIRNVVETVRNRSSRFGGKFSQKYAAWAMSFV